MDLGRPGYENVMVEGKIIMGEADITATNIASKLAATRAGMVPVNSFKWDKKETHADIYQEVFMPPTKKEVNTANRYIDEQFELKDKKVPLNIYSPFSLLLGLLDNYISRRNEFAADHFAAQFGLGKDLSDALKNLSVDNLSNLTPHPTYVFFYYSHPPLLE